MEPDNEAPTISGTIDALGDSDVFELLLAPGIQYRVSVTGEVGLNIISEGLPPPRSDVEELFQDLLTIAVPINGTVSSTFVAQPGVDYFAEVESFFNSFVNPLPYTLTFVEAPDDVPAGVQTSVTVSLGETFEGTYETAADQDWVQLDVTAGDSFLASVAAGFGGSMFLVGYDSNTGEQVDLPFAGVAASITTPQVGFTAQDGVDYFAVLVGSAGGYTFSLTSLPFDDASADTSTTLSVDPGSTTTGIIDAIGDYDWVRLNTTDGASYNVTAQLPGGFASRPLNLIEVDDATGEVVDVVDTVSPNFNTFSAQSGSSYFVEVAPTFSGLYEVTLTELEDDFADNESTTGLLSVGTPVAVVRDFVGDVDLVRLDAEAGQSYIVSNPTQNFRILRSDTITLESTGPLAAAGIFDAPTDESSYFNITALQHEARVDVEAGFEYFVAVEVLPSLPAEFTLTEVASDTLDNAGTNVTLELNQTLTGIYNGSTDQDWIRLDLAAGQSAQLTVNGAFEPNIFAVSEDGSVRLLSDQDFAPASFNSQTVVTGRAGETLYLQTSSPGPLSLTTYTVSLVPIIDDFTNNPDSATELGDGISTFNPTAGADLLEGTANGEQIDGLAGNDTILGFGGNDTLIGNDGSDSINAGLGADEIFGGAGADTINAGNGADTVAGGNGQDLVSLGNGNDLFNDNSQDGTFGQDTVFGGAGNDTIAGGSGNDAFAGGAGNDSITAGLGADDVLGGNGADTISAGSGSDTVTGGNGQDLVFLNQGNDVFNDNAQGGDFGQDTVFAGLGDDTIEGGAGADQFFGQDGNDSITAGLGADEVFGGNGADTISAGNGNDTVTGGNGRDLAFLGDGNDVFNDNDQGSELGQDTVFGGLGSDTIEGGAGADSFFGGNGADVINGGNGADTITSGNGNDTLTGGAGADVFAFTATGQVSGIDLVTDYELGMDMLQVQAATADTVDSTYDATTNTVTVTIFGSDAALLQSTEDLSGFNLDDNLILI